MIWSILSIAMCTALVVKLVFFTDHLRQDSKLFYRITVFASAVYAGKQVIWYLYYPDEPVNPIIAVFHICLFVGAFLIKPHYLEWTRKHHDPSNSH